MPPTSAHFNGSINLEDADAVLNTLARRVGQLVHAYPDGETDEHDGLEESPGNRRYWIFYQIPALEAAHGLKRVEDVSPFPDGGAFPQFALVDPDAEVVFGELGYARDYFDSYQRFQDLKEREEIDQDAKFQIQLPTPFAVMTFVTPADRARVQPAYEDALVTEILRFLQVAGEDVVVQWDVASEFGLLEGWFGPDAIQDPEQVAASLVPLIEAVPDNIQAGVHLCYGDYRHRHLSEPKDIGMQVELVNEIEAQLWNRGLDFVSFTVPQNRLDSGFFQPLSRLVTSAQLFFGIVPYHPGQNHESDTERQVQAIDRYLDGGEWGVSCECGLGRVPRELVEPLINLHSTIILKHGGVRSAAEV